MVNKLCECGCGQPAPIATQTSRRFGWVKDQPMRFVRGHSTRGRTLPRANVAPPNSGGLCQCGCGADAPIAPRTNTERGYVKGEPVRFIPGHMRRKRIRYLVEDRGYDTPCWVWQLHRTWGGYGVVGVGGKGNLAMAHRVYWEDSNGSISDGLQLDHLCRVRACVNPDHLELVTPAENSRRGRATKLTAADVAEIRQMIVAGATDAEAAVRFGVTPGNVWHIRAGRSWAAA